MTTRWLTAGLLGLLAVVPYIGALDFDFVWDDRALILENEHIQDSRLLAEGLTADYWQSLDEPEAKRSFYRPLVTLSFFVDWFLWSDNPSGFHGTNLLLHLLNVLLVYSLLLRFRPSRARVRGRRSFRGAPGSYGVGDLDLGPDGPDCLPARARGLPPLPLLRRSRTDLRENLGRGPALRARDPGERGRDRTAGGCRPLRLPVSSRDGEGASKKHHYVRDHDGDRFHLSVGAALDSSDADLDRNGATVLVAGVQPSKDSRSISPQARVSDTPLRSRSHGVGLARRVAIGRPGFPRRGRLLDSRHLRWIARSASALRVPLDGDLPPSGAERGRLHGRPYRRAFPLFTFGGFLLGARLRL